MTVGPYALQAKLGSGPSGTVYLGVHKDGKRRAIKELAEDLLGDPEIADALLQAVISARRLSHAHVVPIHELLEANGRIYLVTDLVEGIDLGRLFTLRDREPLPTEQATHITLQICAGLAHAHRQPNPVVHGALWPQNVLIDRAGQVRLTDFGSSLAPPEAKRGEVSIRTRYAYRTPEHLTGATLTPRTDVFQVATLLHQMLTGQPAFVGETLMQTVARLQDGEVRVDQAPFVLRAVLAAGLKTDPWARPATVSRFAQSVERAAPPTPQAVDQLVALVAALLGPGSGSSPSSAERPAAPPDDEAGRTPRHRTHPTSAAAPGESPGDDRASASEPPPPGELAEDKTQVTAVEPAPGALAHGELPHGELPHGALPHGALDAIGSTVEEELAPGRPPVTLDELLNTPAPGPALDDGEDLPTNVGDEPGGEAVAELDAGPTQISAPLLVSNLEAPDPQLFETADGAPRPALDDETRSDVDEALFGSSDGHGGRIEQTDTQTETVVEKATAKASAQQAALGQPLPPPNAAGRPKITGPLPAHDDDDLPTNASVLGADEDGSPTGVRDVDADGDGSVVGTRPWAVSELTAPSIEIDAPTQDIRRGKRPDLTPPPLGPPPSSTAVTGLGGEDPSISASVPSVVTDAGSLSGISGVELSGVSFSGMPFDDYDSIGRSFEVDAPSISHPSSMPAAVTPPKPPRRITPAHILLFVAILVFLFAVGLAIRRIIRRPAVTPPTTVTTVTTDGGRADDAVAGATTRRDAGAARPTPADAGATRRPDARLTKAADAAAPASKPDAGPPAFRASLSVGSEPPGTVYVEGQPLGEAPVVIDIGHRWPDRRRLTLAVVASGHEVYRAQIKVKRRGRTKVRVKLKTASYPRATSRRRGYLRVLCKPGDPRRLLLNRRDTGFSCPKVTFALWPGRYRLGFYDFRTDRKKHLWVTVRARHRREIKLARKPKFP